MIKDILFHLSTGAAPDFTTDYTVSVAEAFGAHLSGVAFVYEPLLPATLMGGGLPVDFIEAQRAAAEQAATRAKGKLDEVGRISAISVESRMITASMAGAADLFSQMARRFDLAIVGQADPDTVGPQELIIEATLFQSGRPILVVPYIQRSGMQLERVLVCWDRSRSAARAIGDAMPFLELAKSIDVVVVATERLKSNEMPGAEIAHHLARHGLKVDLRRIVTGGTDVASTILSYASDVSADFIVMGGYGHSRLREFILGGVTRTILSAMTVPTLMSH
jgi:nucleotide-binding universal stress UspA family protein